MSTVDKTTPSVDLCASCGIAGVDDIKLKLCDGGCDLVKYCSDYCQELHREQHHEECMKRKEELRDKKLFTQPDSSHYGECPLCCLPLSIDARKSTFMPCCSKVLCNGCNHANRKREDEQGLEHRCAFCREPEAKSQEEYIKRIMERVKKNDAVAMTEMGKNHSGKKEYAKSLEYWTKAAELGDVGAYFCLASSYYMGEGVQRDTKKAMYHLEQAAIGGYPDARGILASEELKNERPDRAAKHFIIAANLGCDDSLKCIKELFVKGIVSKEEYAAALRGYQTAVVAAKSPEREKAEKAIKNGLPL